MEKSLTFLVTSILLGFVLCSCGTEDKDKPEAEEIAIRGYWVCDAEDLALEIVSAAGLGLPGTSSLDNVYRLWYIGAPSPECYVDWTSQVGYFQFFSPDYSWRDKVYVLSYTEDSLILEGLDIYSFRRISHEVFYNIVMPSSTESGEGSSTGNDNSSSGSGTDSHRYPCKSCDETGECWQCFGSGTNPATQKTCNLCHGSGKCPICRGRGYTII